VRVLIVDDDPAILRMLVRVLTVRGHEVDGADSPYGVSAVVQQRQPDVVLLDVMMPGLSGTSLAQLIEKLDMPTRPTVILYSAMPEDQLRKAALGVGARYVSKTRGPGAIVTEIERAFAAVKR
jgi:DNA-binding response OmpR family regulator